jgi:tRNA(Phe) wybutosine-synthesizing methylase Tyw3
MRASSGDARPSRVNSGSVVNTPEQVLARNDRRACLLSSKQFVACVLTVMQSSCNGRIGVTDREIATESAFLQT